MITCLRVSRAVLLICSLGVFGCSPDMPEAVQLPTASDLDQAAGPKGGVGSSEVASGGWVEPSGVIGLRDALSAALAQSPELASFGWVVRAREAEVLQASMRPNPEFTIAAENFVGSGVFGNQVQFQNTLQLSQLVELGEKRRRRTESAAFARDAATLEYEAKRVEVLASTTLDFISVIGNQEAVAIARGARLHAEALLDAVRKRVAAGAGSVLEEVRAEVAVRRAKIVEHHAEHELKSSKQQLAGRWGSKAPGFTEAKGDVYSTRPVPPFESLLERLNAAPERQASLAVERLKTAEAALARTKRVPDVMIGVGWRHGRDWDDQAAVAELTMPLQVFDRFEGEIAAAEAMSTKAPADTRAIEVRLRALLFSLYQELTHARDEVTAMRQEIVPRSERALTLARDGYSQGLFTQLEVIDAQQTLTEVRKEYLAAATTFHRLTAELERVLGSAL